MSEETRKKKSANYVLELCGEKSAEGWLVWLEIKDGFISPEKALDYAKDKKIKGAIRVVRVASPIYGGSVVTPEPIYTLEKIGTEEKPARAKGRPRKAAKLTDPVTTSSGEIAPAPSPLTVPLTAHPEDTIPPDEGANSEDLDAVPG